MGEWVERRTNGGEVHQWCNCMNRLELALRFEIVLQQLVLGCGARSGAD